jgi:bacillopeptidase F (M6 metalloprotease family)
MMILYQMAKRLEQRNQLKETIGRTEGNVEELLTKKEQVEEQLQLQANVWTEEGQDAFTLSALTPEIDGTQTTYSW